LKIEFFYFFEMLTISAAKVQWEKAFYEWHLHRTTVTEVEEQIARKKYLRTVQKAAQRQHTGSGSAFIV
tara:strand:- start:339 stop:545 length:207 start_codon:yes stop_codon:yes gene_type:complete